MPTNNIIALLTSLRKILSIGLEDQLVDIRGHAVHVRSTDHGVYEIGIEFVNPDERMLHTIRYFIRSLSKE